MTTDLVSSLVGPSGRLYDQPILTTAYALDPRRAHHLTEDQRAQRLSSVPLAQEIQDEIAKLERELGEA